MKIRQLERNGRTEKMNALVQVIARSPPAILLALGGIGWLAHIQGAGTLLTWGVILQCIWLFLFRRI